MIDPHDRPLQVEIEDGHVVVDGGPGVAVTLTAEAAADTSDDLLHKANQALGQRTMDAVRAAEDAKNRR